MHLLSFCPQNISRIYRIKKFNRTLVDVNTNKKINIKSVQRNATPTLSIRGCVTEPRDGNVGAFIHPYSLTCMTGNVAGFYTIYKFFKSASLQSAHSIT